MDNLAIYESTDLLPGYTPEAAMIRAKEAVNTVMKVIASRPKPLVINGKQYLEYQDWRLLALYFGITTKTDNVAEMNELCEVEVNGVTGNRIKFIGYVVEASALRDGKVLTTSSAECTRHEKAWVNKDRFQIREMATIRAKRSALKDVLRWVFSMASLDMPELEKVEVDKDVDDSERLF